MVGRSTTSKVGVSGSRRHVPPRCGSRLGTSSMGINGPMLGLNGVRYRPAWWQDGCLKHLPLLIELQQTSVVLTSIVSNF